MILISRASEEKDLRLMGADAIVSRFQEISPVQLKYKTEIVKNDKVYIGDSDLLGDVCVIRFRDKFLDSVDLDGLEYVIGHEMGHCFLNHTEETQLTGYKEKTPERERLNWEQEYDADFISFALMKKLGMNPSAGFHVFHQYIGRSPDLPSHPKADRRYMQLLNGSKTYRVGPVARPFATYVYTNAEGFLVIHK